MKKLLLCLLLALPLAAQGQMSVSLTFPPGPYAYFPNTAQYPFCPATGTCSGTITAPAVVVGGAVGGIVSTVWAYQSGATFVPNIPTAPTSFSFSMESGVSWMVGTWKVTVTSGTSQVASATFDLRATRILNVNASTAPVYATCTGVPCIGSITTPTVTISGGSGSYLYGWPCGDNWAFLAAIQYPNVVTAQVQVPYGVTWTACAETLKGIDTVSGAIGYQGGVPSSANSTTFSVTNPATVTVTASSYSVAGSCTNVQYCTVNLSKPTAAATGGAGTYTYTWEYVSGNTGFVNNMSLNKFTFGFVNYTTPVSAVWRVKAVDSNGITGYSPGVTLTAAWIVPPALVVALGYTAVTTPCPTSAPCTATTLAPSVGINNGSGAYAYSAWAYVAGTACTITGTPPAAQFACAVPSGSTSISSTYRIQATDTATGATGWSPNFVITSTPAVLAASTDGDAFGYCMAAKTCTATSNYVTCSAFGGTPPYTYAWSRVSGTAYAVSGTLTNVRRWALTHAVPYVTSAVYRCTVTDSKAATASSMVSVSSEHDSNL